LINIFFGQSNLKTWIEFKQRKKGHIISLGSVAGREPYVGGSIYCATKHALRAFTESMRKELVDTPIRVTEVQPGLVETEFSVVRFRGDKAAADAVYENLDPRELPLPRCLIRALTLASSRRRRHR
jgi:NADP-dependent 3-hydroxy acid dehydrogenase YdfG